MTKGRFRFAALVTTLALSTVVTPATAATGAEAGPRPPGRTVTLVTGDRVTLTGRDQVRVRPAPGRERMGFQQRLDEHGDVTVVPDDAREEITAGRLDSRLFDISLLAENGYGDHARNDLPLIITYDGGQSRATRPLAAVSGVRELASIGATAVRAAKASVPAVWAQLRSRPAGIKRVSLDGPVRADLDHSVPRIGAPQAWQAGHTGAGTTVAVLDSGIDATHPDLADAVAEAQDFTGGADGTDDRYGHGTHVASIITGSGAASAGAYRGVAPDTRLLVGKVLDDTGGGSESAIIAGMEWAVGKGAKVVNMSLGSPPGGGKDGGDPVSDAVNRLTAQSGALFVVSAGNNGPNGVLTSPGVADAALTVGAVDRDDQLAGFSGRGPRAGDGAIKPDLTAPGVDIVAARAANGRIGTPAADGYVALSGTSMAVPHVAGAAALLAGEHPDWPAARLKAALTNSAQPHPGLSVYQQGAGRVDVARATGQPVQAIPAGLSLGRARWPHTDDQPITATLTYSNSGPAPVVLEVTTDVRDSTGQAAPGGMFTVSPNRLTVPAGGAATATVTADTRVDGPDGTYGGFVVATGGGSTVRTPAGLQRESESHDVKLNFVDWQGNPAVRSNTYWFVDLDRPVGYSVVVRGGSAVARLPRGRYFLQSTILGRNEENDLITALFAEPVIAVTADVELTLDARTAQPAGMTVDRPNARDSASTLTFATTTAHGPTWARTSAPFGRTWVRPSTTTAPGFTYTAEALLAEPDGRGGFDRSPYLYHLRWSEPGRVPTDVARRFADRDLASVRGEHASTGPGQTGSRDFVVTAALPFTLQEFYSPDTAWESFFEQSTEDGYLADASSVPRTFRRGECRVEQWNKAVFGPSFPRTPARPAEWAGRRGDTAYFDLWMLGDQNGDHYGRPADAGTATTALHRNGQQVAEYPWTGYSEFTLPPEEAAYRLHAESVRSDPADLSTRVVADWTFRSGHVTGTDAEPVPLTVVRFAPDLDDQNRAPAGAGFPVPVYVQQTVPSAAVAKPAVQVSYDEGTTWRPVPLRRAGDHWLARLQHPAGAASVSLRATAADGDGNSVTQEVIRAYRLK
ncbi:S8 family serine peptidase [Amycolatopsis sp. H6(2020)]|nr:S8 family serine peptidase [Amycolatopsis sp. H6(2020)]